MQINVNNDDMLGRTKEKTLHITLIQQQREIDRLNNIIKEVREYVENKQKLNKMFGTITLSKDSQKELLEILDKGE